MTTDIESLESTIEKNESAESRINALNQLSWLKRRNDIRKSLELATQAYEESKKSNYKKGLAYSQLSLAFHDYTTQGKINQSIETFLQVIELFKELGDDFGRGMTHSLLSYVYWSTADYENGFQHLLEGEEYQEKSGNTEGVAWDKFNFGSYYSELNYHDLAAPYFQESLDLFVEIGEHFGRASSINGLARICIEQKDYDKAIEHCEESIGISDENGFSDSKASALKILGEIYGKRNDYTKAIEFTRESLELYHSTGDQQGIISTEVDMGIYHCANGSIDEAINHFELVLKIANDANAFSDMIKAHEHMANIYGDRGESDKALHHYKEYVRLKEAIMGDTSSNQMQKMQAVFNVKQARQETEIQRLINTELAQANEEIELQKEKIVSSIRYAKRIQDSMLSPVSALEEELSEVFMIFQPKDIVSGDFYWFNRVGDSFVMAAIDCTGHGVPGAFMTLMGNSILNNIILTDKIVDPSQILYELDKRLLKNLASDSAAQSNDGMDMAVVTINKKEGKMRFSGAKNPLFSVKGGLGDLTKGSKFPIGSQQFKRPKEFETSEYNLDADTTHYLYSDGFPDQFGGESGNSKFLSKRFRAMLEVNSQLPLVKQKELLEKELAEWKGDNKQTDDIIVIGFKV